MVKSNEIESVQSYLQRVTNKCFIGRSTDDNVFIEDALDQEGFDKPKRFALNDVKEMVESNLDVVLVECFKIEDDGNISSKLWWYEIPKERNEKKGIEIMEKTIYCVAGLGYLEDGTITDYERDWGEFDTVEQAKAVFDAVVYNAKENLTTFFKDDEKVDGWLIQLEKCIEDDDGVYCEDVLADAYIGKA